MKIVDIKTNTIMDKVTTNVVIGTKLIADECKSYRRLSFLFKHDFVKYSKGEYVIVKTSTNTIEGFFSLLKRGILEIYHFVSEKHLLFVTTQRKKPKKIDSIYFQQAVMAD